MRDLLIVVFCIFLFVASSLSFSNFLDLKWLNAVVWKCLKAGVTATRYTLRR